MAAPTGPTAGDARVVYFGNLDRKAADEDLQKLAASVGRVETIARKRNFAYVTYATATDAAKAVGLTGQKLGERELRVEASRTETERDAARKPREDRPARKPRAARPAPAGGDAAAAEEPRFYDNRIVVKGLPADFDSDALAKVFAACGTITKARVGAKLGRVTFETPEAAARALLVTNQKIGEHTITVDKEQVRRRRPRAAAGASESAPKRAPREAAPRVAREPAAPRRVRVDKLAAGTTSDQLKAYFGGVGRVSSAKVIEGRNHGFVTFEDAATATKALGLNGSNIGGSTVEVSLDARARRAAREPAATEAGAGRRRAADEEEREPRDVTNTTWVGGLDTEKATEESIRKAFGSFGSIVSVEIISGGRSAFIKYTTEAGVNSAVAALNDKTIDIAAKPLRVQVATGKSAKPRTAGAGGRRRTGGRRGGAAAAAQ